MGIVAIAVNLQSWAQGSFYVHAVLLVRKRLLETDGHGVGSPKVDNVQFDILRIVD